jgi:predicted permease
VSPGFDPRGVIAFNVTPAESLAHQSPEAIRAAYRAMHTAMASVPGVASVSFNDGAYPMRFDNEQVFWVEGLPHAEHTADLPLAVHYSVNAEYLQLMRLPLLRGRFIGASDTEHSPSVVVIDEHLAEHFFPGQNPIGKHLHFTQESSGGDRVDEIVGVVGHVKQFGLAPDKANNVEAEVYEAFAQHPDHGINLVGEGTRAFVRVAEGVKPESVFPSIRRSLQELDNQIVVDDLHSIQEYVDESIARQRFAMMLFSIFAAGALLLASIGIYGVLSYIVGQRTREIGIRMALGADKDAVRGVVLRDGARMTLPGIAIGLVAALGLVRLMSAMLFGVKPTDVLTFAGVSGLLLLVALLACCIPAQRAARLDPMQALRMD